MDRRRRLARLAEREPGNGNGLDGRGALPYQETLAPGWYQWKAVVTGSWDSIGDDFRSVSSSMTWFEVTGANPTAVFQVNAATGVVRVDVVPEPATVCLLCLGAMAAIRRRRRT